MANEARPPILKMIWSAISGAGVIALSLGDAQYRSTWVLIFAGPIGLVLVSWPADPLGPGLVDSAIAATGAVAIGTILVTNIVLPWYFRAIAGAVDREHERVAASVVTALLFISLIASYGWLQLLIMGPDLARPHSTSAGACPVDHWINAFYFSASTITTTGFGDIVPVGRLSRLLATVEPINGLVVFGLLISALTKYLDD